MKVRVEQTVEVSDAYRRAINAHYGRPGLATREEVRRWVWSFGTSMDDDLAQPVECGNCLYGGDGPDPDCPMCDGTGEWPPED